MKRMVAIYISPEDHSESEVVASVVNRLGIALRRVKAEDAGQRVGALCGLAGFDAEESPTVTIEEPVLLLYNVSGSKLDRVLTDLRAAGQKNLLKAVVTPHNCAWPVYKLYTELCRERNIMMHRKEDET